MEQWIWLLGAIVVVMVLWLIWSLSGLMTGPGDTGEIERPRPPRRAAPPVQAPPSPLVAADPATLTPIGLPKAEGPPDDLLAMKGVGPKLNTLLGELGVTRYDQIAAWTADDVAKLDAHLGTFQGRALRDNWVEQAGYLAKGDKAGFEAKFGKL